MGIHDKLPGVQRSVPLGWQDLAYRDGVLDEELLRRLQLVFAQGLDSQAYGIVAGDNPQEIDGSDTTQSLAVTLTDGNSSYLTVYPGKAVTPSGHVIVIDSPHDDIQIIATAVGGQTVAYLEYQNEETELRPMRSRVTGSNARISVKDESDLIKTLERSDFEALDAITLTRVVALALVTIQQVDSTGATIPVISYDAETIAYNRPWFSPVDIMHRRMVGSGTQSSNNPHGQTLNDLMVAGDLSLYDLFTGRGMIIAPDASYAKVPGTGCDEVIPNTRWVRDEDTSGNFDFPGGTTYTGEVTDKSNAYYVELEGYPIAIGACLYINGDEDTADYLAVPIERIENTNVIFVQGDLFRRITIVTSGGFEFNLYTTESGLGGNGVTATVSSSSSAGSEAISEDAGARTISIVIEDGVSDFVSLKATVEAAISGGSITLLSDVGYSPKYTIVPTFTSADAQTVTNIADDATFTFRYTSASALEPPVTYNDEPHLTFKVPQGSETIISDGLAFNALSVPQLDFDEIGPIPRRIWVTFDDADELILYPQVLIPFTRLSDFTDDSVEVSTALRGPGRVRLWLVDAIASALLDVQITVTGTDRDGAALTETVTFGSSWVSNPAPSETEEPNQVAVTDAVFASVTEVSIDARVNDGPQTAVLVEVAPDFIYEETSINRNCLVARVFWNGFRSSKLWDLREVYPNVTSAFSRPTNEVLAESILGMRSLFQPSTEETVVYFDLGDDALDMRNSDLKLTRRFALRSRKGPDDPVESSSVGSFATSGIDSYYYSRVIRAPDGMTWAQIIFLGRAQIFSIGSNQPEIRWSIASDPDEWSDWTSMNSSAVAFEGRDGREIVYYIDLVNDGDMDFTDSVYAYQIRMIGHWAAFAVLLGEEEPNFAASELAQCIDRAFKVNHWECDEASATEGWHAAMLVYPRSGEANNPIGSVPETSIIVVNANEGQKIDPTTLYFERFFGWDDSSAPALTEQFYITLDGDGWFRQSLSIGSAILLWDATFLRVTVDVLVDGDFTVTGNYQWDATRTFNDVVPLSHIAQILNASPAGANDWYLGSVSWQETSAVVPGSLTQTAILLTSTGDWIRFSIDEYIRNNCTLDQVELIVSKNIAGSVTVTVDLHGVLVTGVGAVWTLLATDSVVYTSAVAADRQRLLFDINTVMIELNLYTLTFTLTAGVDATIHRVTLRQQSTVLRRALNAYS